MPASFDSALQAAAARLGWPEELREEVTRRQAELRADPEGIAREIATAHLLPLEDEVALRGLATPGVPLMPPQKRTVWVQEGPPVDRPTPRPPAPRETRRVDGRTLASMIRDPLDEHAVTDALHALAVTVGNAHRRGLVLRNLGPTNVLVGDLGEVMVRDPAAELVPACCAPELADDPTGPAGPPADVFALGCMLFEAFSGVSWFARIGRDATLTAVRDDDRRPAERRVPPSVLQVANRATARDPGARFADGHAFAAAMVTALGGGLASDDPTPVPPDARGPASPPSDSDAFDAGAFDAGDFDGSLFGPDAWDTDAQGAASEPEEGEESDPELVAEARGVDEAIASRKEAERLAELARAALAALGPDAPIEQKTQAWAAEQAAREKAAEADRLDHVALDALREVAFVTGEDADHDAVAAHLHRMYRVRDARGEAVEHLADAVARHDRSGRFKAWCEGTGRLSLITDPPADVELYAYTARDRRLWPTPARTLGRTPLADVPLEQGSWMCIARARDGREVRVPVLIRRRTHWHGVPPGSGEARPVRMLAASELPEGHVHVPAGWFSCGGPDADALPRAWVWLEPFVIQQHPVRMGEYLTFLTALKQAGRRAVLELCQPPPMPSGGGLWPRVAWKGKRFEIVGGPEDRPWEPSWPAGGVPYAGAVEYARWKAGVDGLPWRLPTELEWEKAARGVDGRLHPWGDEVDPMFARYQAATPADPEAFPADSSPYGVRGMAGNVRDWVDEPWRPPAVGFRIARGGDFASGAWGLSATRRAVVHASGSPVVGFRLARSV